MCRAKLAMPQTFSLNAQHIIHMLFKRNPRNRIGSGVNGARDLYAHAFFKGVNFMGLLDRSVRAPWLPLCTAANPTVHFDAEFTSMPPMGQCVS